MIHNLWLIIDLSMLLQKLSLYSMLRNLEPVRTSLNWFSTKNCCWNQFPPIDLLQIKVGGPEFYFKTDHFHLTGNRKKWPSLVSISLVRDNRNKKNQAPIVSFSHVPVVLFKPWLIGDSWETESWAPPPPHDVLLSGTAVTASYMMLIEPKVILQNPKTIKIHATRVFNRNLKIVIRSVRCSQIRHPL